jgi:hypothetical protein
MPRQLTLDEVIYSWIEELADKVHRGEATEEEERELFKYLEDEI